MWSENKRAALASRRTRYNHRYMWTRTDALLIYKALLSPAAEQHGFSAALYGSVLLGDETNDLDLFMVPQRQDANVEAFLETLRRHMRVGELGIGIEIS